MKNPKRKDPFAPPPKLLRFMLRHWAHKKNRSFGPLPELQAHRARRAQLSALFPQQTLVIPSGHEKVRSNDTYFGFRPHSDFVYLTGCHEPDAVLVLVPTKRGHESHLFLHPNLGRKSEAFFTDRKRGELWNGAYPTILECKRMYRVDVCHDLKALASFIKKAKYLRACRGISRDVDGCLNNSPTARRRDAELVSALSELRLYKDEAEIAHLQAAIDATHRGFEDVIRGLPRATSERHVETAFSTRARIEGNGVGYGTIAASGVNACTLHWHKNHGPVKKGELLLLDAGVEGNALYTADITRTLPVSGRFSPVQRRVYQLVWEAQQAAIAAVQPGNDFMEPNRRAMQVLATGLHKFGLLPMGVEAALKEEHQYYKRYTLHNVSHMLGLDVHDCAKARNEVYRFGALKPGMVLTVEPGLYFQPDDKTVPKSYRGLGVRIEDDVLVTEKGCRVLSRKIPSSADGIEAWMKKLQSSSVK